MLKIYVYFVDLFVQTSIRTNDWQSQKKLQRNEDWYREWESNPQGIATAGF